MTIGSRQPLLYFLLLIILLQWSQGMEDNADGTYSNNNNNYDDTFYQDMNYYDTLANSINFDVDKALLQQKINDQEQIETEQGEPMQPFDGLQIDADKEQDMLQNKDISQQLLVREVPEFRVVNRKRETGENGNLQHQDEEQRVAYTCHAQTPEQQACLDAAVKDTKDTIEHVTCLIKRMREHAVAIVKEVNELEGDFLGACRDERPKLVCRKRPPSRGKCRGHAAVAEEETGGVGYIDGVSGFKRIYDETAHAINSNQNNQNDNENMNSAAAMNEQGNENNNGNESSGNSQNVNTNTNSRPNSKGAPTKPRIVVNEFAIPMKTDISDLPPNEFMEQAQYAVHAWKNQIEECKRLLDEAMLRATQHSSGDGVDSPNTSVQHIIKIVRTPEEAEGAHEDDAAPAAAASITPVRCSNFKECCLTNKNTDNNINNDTPFALNNARRSGIAALTSDKINDEKLNTSNDVAAKAVHGDNNNDADIDTDNEMNDSNNNNKRNEGSKRCRSEGKKHRSLPPLLSVLQGMGF
ncbi:probable serine/threonine-protein kinase cdc7 [Ceratitis capitata]|uniref:probable serine/threonine-protein kinase cdc7 n=1 Tax=Ceratitis capitata TaxID=7213 RepID=UPI000329B6F2|nr:probable serine/threonine-protein kinase cdc7 [Ceratitis capitata]